MIARINHYHRFSGEVDAFSSGMMDFNIRERFESSQWRIVVPVPPTQIRQSFAQFLPADKIGLGADANDVEITAQSSSHQHAGVAHANNDNGLSFCLTSGHSAISADLKFFVLGLDYLTLNGVRSAG